MNNTTGNSGGRASLGGPAGAPADSSKNLTKLDIEEHDRTALQYSIEESSKTVERSETMLVSNNVKIGEDEEQKFQIMVADQKPKVGKNTPSDVELTTSIT